MDQESVNQAALRIGRIAIAWFAWEKQWDAAAKHCRVCRVCLPDTPCVQAPAFPVVGPFLDTSG